jgi:nitrogen fixation/metabolism regulation signal transduction histidine kinase
MSTDPSRTAERRTNPSSGGNGGTATSRRVDAGPSLGANRQQLLWAILENLSEGVVACDATGALSFFNRATREFHGISGTIAVRSAGEGAGATVAVTLPRAVAA